MSRRLTVDVDAVAGCQARLQVAAHCRGVRVLEMGQLIAGPFGGQLLGYVLDASNLLGSDVAHSHFGAEVIKIEPPGIGDPLGV